MKYSQTHLDEIKYIQIAKNYYAFRDEWLEMNEVERHVEMCVTVAMRRKTLMFTGQSACAIYGIPRISPFVMRPHCIRNQNKRSDFICWRHGPLDPKAKVINGLLLASPERTICDSAKYDSSESLLVSINHSLYKKLLTIKKLEDEIDIHNKLHGKRKLVKLLKMASAKCESPLETLAFIEMQKAGFVLPQQQVEIYDKKEFVARVDMYWEFKRRKIILELDGKIKYSNNNSLFLEKKREDKLRALGYEVIRETWYDVQCGELIKSLRKTKIPMRRNYKNAFPHDKIKNSIINQG